MIPVGFVGLGSMGSAIASILITRGVHVRVWNRSVVKIAPLIEVGATAAASLQDVLASPISISMLADDEAVASVLTTKALRAAAGGIHVCMSSISPEASDELGQRCHAAGVGYVAAPVLGRPEVASRGELNVIAAGPEELVEQVQDLLDIVGTRTWRVGSDPRTANVVKVAVNYNIIHALESMGESIALVEAHGGSASEFADLLCSTLFGGAVHQVYGRMIAERSYWPAGFSLRLGLKDLNLASRAAEEVALNLPSVRVLRDAFERALRDERLDDADWSAIAEGARLSVT